VISSGNKYDVCTCNYVVLPVSNLLEDLHYIDWLLCVCSILFDAGIES